MVVENSNVQRRIDELTESTALSTQDARVLALLEENCSRATIAEQLDISQSDVSKSVYRIYQQQSIADRTFDLQDDRSGRCERAKAGQSLPGFEIESDGRRQLFLSPVASGRARERFEPEIIEGIDIKEYRELIPNQFNETISIAGTGADAGEKVERGDVVAFYVGDGTYSHIAVVRHAERNEALDEALWNADEESADDDDSWPMIQYLTNPVEVNLDDGLLHDDIGYKREHQQGFARVAPRRVADLYEKYGNLERYFEQARDRSAATGRDTQVEIDMHVESSTGPATQTNAADQESEQASLEELQERAEEASRDAVAETAGQRTNQRRSEAVRRYALARADGICEGCDQEAPFLTQSGDPYLEVHYVFHVSDEGVDRPDSVIAICPTCHKRVHHAADGSEYNAELIAKLQTEIEPEA